MIRKSCRLFRLDHTTNKDINWSLRFNLPELHSSVSYELVGKVRKPRVTPEGMLFQILLKEFSRAT